MVGLIQCYDPNRMAAPKAIIVHTHKCGGASLRFALIHTFGANQVREDYTHGMQNPASLLNTDPERYWHTLRRDPVEAIVIGHLPIAAYDHVTDALRIALLRHPVDRMISHYFFWLYLEPPNDKNPLWHSVRNGKVSLEEFSRLPLIQGLYRHGYFQRTDMRLFDLLIVYERLTSGIDRLSRLIGAQISFPTTNVTAQIWPSYAADKAAIKADAMLWERLSTNLREETGFYQKCIHLPNAA